MFWQTKYRCKICLIEYLKTDLESHVCEDNRKLWDTRIIKKGFEYHVQGEFCYSPHPHYLPMPYWDTLSSHKTKKDAKKAEQILLEENDMYVVE